MLCNGSNISTRNLAVDGAKVRTVALFKPFHALRSELHVELLILVLMLVCFVEKLGLFHAHESCVQLHPTIALSTHFNW